MVTCQKCVHWQKKDNNSWGICQLGKTGIFVNHCSRGKYLAIHTQARYKGNKACKTRFIAKEK